MRYVTMVLIVVLGVVLCGFGSGCSDMMENPWKTEPQNQEQKQEVSPSGITLLIDDNGVVLEGVVKIKQEVPSSRELEGGAVVEVPEGTTATTRAPISIRYEFKKEEPDKPEPISASPPAPASAPVPAASVPVPVPAAPAPVPVPAASVPVPVPASTISIPRQGQSLSNGSSDPVPQAAVQASTEHNYYVVNSNNQKIIVVATSNPRGDYSSRGFRGRSVNYGAPDQALDQFFDGAWSRGCRPYRHSRGWGYDNGWNGSRGYSRYSRGTLNDFLDLLR